MLQAANWCEKTIKTAKLDVFRSQFLRMIERWDVVIFRRHSFFVGEKTCCCAELTYVHIVATVSDRQTDRQTK